MRVNVASPSFPCVAVLLLSSVFGGTGGGDGVSVRFIPPIGGGGGASGGGAGAGGGGVAMAVSSC